jgi:hypothetical protein
MKKILFVLTLTLLFSCEKKERCEICTVKEYAIPYVESYELNDTFEACGDQIEVWNGIRDTVVIDGIKYITIIDCPLRDIR